MYKPSPLVRGATLFVISMLLVLRGGSAFRAIGGRVAPSALVQRTIKSSTALFAEVKRMSALQFGAIINDPDTRAQYQIVDVREANELEVACIAGDDVIHLPLSTAGEWTNKVTDGDILDSEKPVLCLCHHGMRSMRVATFLTGQAEFEDVYNVEGGIDQVSSVVDPSIPKY